MIFGSLAMSLVIGVFGIYIAFRAMKGGFKILKLFFDAIEDWISDRIG